MNQASTSIGVDIIEISRIKRAVSRWNDAFLKRVYSQAELDYCRSMYPSLAARFAAKEAVIKTLGRGGSGFSWLEIEILPGPNDAPYVKLSGRARRKAEELGLKDLSISLSHCNEYAVAFSVGHAE